MNKWNILFLITLLIQCAMAQTKSENVEFGATLFTSSTYPSLENLKFSANSKLQVQYLNGIFVRVNIQQVAIRGIFQYHTQRSTTVPEPNCADCQTKDEFDKEYKFGFGFQFNLIPKEDWFYSFADVSYRNLNQNGVYTGGFSGDPLYFQKESKGIETFTGVGFKVGLWHRIFFSPEIGMSIFNGYSELHQSSSTGRYAPIKSHDFTMSPLVRMHFTIALNKPGK